MSTLNLKFGGGVSQLVMALTRFLRETGWEPVVFFPHFRRHEFPPYVQEFLREQPYHEFWKIPRVRALWSLDPMGRIPQEFDIYQSVGGTCLEALAFYRRGFPFFCWAATTIRSEASGYRLSLWGRLQIRFASWLESRIVRRAQHVFVLSNFTKRSLMEQMGLDADNITTTMFPVDLERFSPAVPYAQREDYILFVGRQDERKNLGLLLRAFAIVAQQVPRLHLKIVGNWRITPKSNLGRLLDQLDLEDRISFEGVVQDVVPFYQRALLTVLPSHQEGFGIVLAESLACGTPVVATRCGGPEDIVTEGVDGFLVPRNDPLAFAEAILKVVTDSSRGAEMGYWGRRKAEREFNIEYIGRKFLEVYKRFLGE